MRDIICKFTGLQTAHNFITKLLQWDPLMIRELSRALNFHFQLKAHCRGCYWLVVMLKSKTKLWPVSNYNAFMLSYHTLFRE